jgi:FdrA protein
MRDHLEVRSGVYADSVSLMQVSRRVADVDGVDAALIAMATELNLDMLTSMGFDAPAAGPNDLLVAIRLSDDATLDGALAELDAALAATRGSGADAGFGDAAPPRTVRDAAVFGGDLVLISTPGEHAFVEAMDALRADKHVMVFSDNVPLDHEIALKAEAARRGLLMMGPDAGTAMVSGVGLGFANVVAPGPVGIVAASGTGAQQLMCLLDDAGVGVTHVLGVGGRDLSADVQGAATLQALKALDADPGTELIVLLSKPPDAEVAARVRAVADGLSTPVITALLGPDADDLTATVGQVLVRLDVEADAPRSWTATVDRAAAHDELRGLFAGGTLCDEAMAIAAAQLGPIRSNIPLDDRADWALTDGLDTEGHVVVDLGEDEFTRGRPHPMIDQSLRVDRLRAEAARPGSRVVLLDVVLGHGAHADPASELAPAIAAAIAEAVDDLAVVVSLCGSSGDPQGRDRQTAALVDAGASVHLSNAAAAREAVALIGAR